MSQFFMKTSNDNLSTATLKRSIDAEQKKKTIFLARRTQEISFDERKIVKNAFSIYLNAHFC